MMSLRGSPIGKLSYVINKLAESPPDFHLNRKLKRVLEAADRIGGRETTH